MIMFHLVVYSDLFRVDETVVDAPYIITCYFWQNKLPVEVRKLVKKSYTCARKTCKSEVTYYCFAAL